jgi:hypothetical protein
VDLLNKHTLNRHTRTALGHDQVSEILGTSQNIPGRSLAMSCADSDVLAGRAAVRSTPATGVNDRPPTVRFALINDLVAIFIGQPMRLV